MPGIPWDQGCQPLEHEIGRPGEIETTVGNHERSDIGYESWIIQFLEQILLELTRDTLCPS